MPFKHSFPSVTMASLVSVFWNGTKMPQQCFQGLNNLWPSRVSAAVPVHSIVSQPAILLQILHASIGLAIFGGKWNISQTAQGPGIFSYKTITHWLLCAEQMSDHFSSLKQTAQCCLDIVTRTRFSSLEAQSASVPPSLCSLTGLLQTTCFWFCCVCKFVFHVSVTNSGHGWFIYPFSTMRSVSQRVSVGGAWLLEWR